jgi:hypothetical protein
MKKLSHLTLLRKAHVTPKHYDGTERKENDGEWVTERQKNERKSAGKHDTWRDVSLSERSHFNIAKFLRTTLDMT